MQLLDILCILFEVTLGIATLISILSGNADGKDYGNVIYLLLGMFFVFLGYLDRKRLQKLKQEEFVQGQEQLDEKLRMKKEAEKGS